MIAVVTFLCLILATSHAAHFGGPAQGGGAALTHTPNLDHTPQPNELRVTDLNSWPLDYSHTIGVYTRRGYSTCPMGAAHQRGWLYLQKPLDCKRLFEDVLRAQSGPPFTTAPKHIPSLFRGEYLLDGNVNLIDFYRSNIYNGNPEPLDWNETYVEKYIESIGVRKQGGSYGAWDNAVYSALDSLDLEGKTGLVVGSERPWVEAAALYRGAKHVTTSEYRSIIATHPRLGAAHPREMAEAFLKGSLEPFDFAASYSSIEHSGLGRYGDPLDPQGDLREVEKVSCLVKPGGMFLLGFPFNNDAVIWNVHRLYGPVRLPLVTANWEVVAVYGLEDKKGDFDMTPIFLNDDNWTHKNQLVAVLRNRRTKPCL
jgi:hypothetical protein